MSSVPGIKALSILLQVLNRMTFEWKDLSITMRKALMRSLSDSLVIYGGAYLTAATAVAVGHMPSYLSIVLFLLGKLNAPWRELEQFMYIPDRMIDGGEGMYPSRIEFHRYDDSSSISSSRSGCRSSSTDEIDDIDQWINRIALHSHYHDDDDHDDNSSNYASRTTRSMTVRHLVLSSLCRNVMLMNNRQIANVLYGLKELGATWKDLDHTDESDHTDDISMDYSVEKTSSPSVKTLSQARKSSLQLQLLDCIENMIPKGWTAQGHVSIQLGLEYLLNTTRTHWKDRLIDLIGDDSHDGDDTDDRLLYHYIHLLRNASLV